MKSDVPKTILITGASRGIGRQLALNYAQPHVNLILIARNAEKLADVGFACQEQGAQVIWASIDVRDHASVKQFVSDIDQKMPIDLVIANSGVASTLQPNWGQEKEEDILDAFTTNLQGALNTITPLIERMITRRKGQIALMSSLAGYRGMPQSPSYSASKAALRVYAQSLRAWLQRYQIKVNVICPGYVKTSMSDRLQGPKPFLVSCEKAAFIIQKGLSVNKACIAFPWQLHLLTQLSMLLPSRWVNAILNQFESYVCAKTEE